jgi:hypothetical protein
MLWEGRELPQSFTGLDSYLRTSSNARKEAPDADSQSKTNLTQNLEKCSEVDKNPNPIPSWINMLR